MKRRFWLVTLLVGVGALLVGAGVASTAPPKKCPKGKIARVANGKRTCVPAKAYRQRVTPLTPAASQFQRALAASPIKLQQKNGKVVAGVMRPKLAAATLAAFSVAEAELRAAIGAKALQSVNRTMQVAADSPPVVTRSPDGSVSGSLSRTVEAGGQSATMTIGLTGHPPAGAAKDGTIDVEVGLAVDGGKGSVKSTAFRIKGIGFAPRQTCPDSKGFVTINDGFSGGTNNSETFGSSAVKLGTVREGIAVTGKVTGRAKIGSDGKFAPFPISVTATLDYSRSAQALAFLQSRQRAVASGTLTGTLNPATGQLSGASIASKVRTSGFDGPQAAVDAAFRTVIEKMLNDQAGSAMKILQKVEENVANGLCDGSYAITVTIDTDAVFATNDATGTLRANVTATPTGGAKPAKVFDGAVEASYSGVVFTSKTPGCSYANEPPGQGTLTFHLEATPADTIHVTWQASNTLDAKGTVTCPGPPQSVVPGQAGPSLVLPTPEAFDLPLDGGNQPIAGGFAAADGHWVHSGTISITRTPPPK